jgi:hypothetical protein
MNKYVGRRDQIVVGILTNGTVGKRDRTIAKDAANARQDRKSYQNSDF